MTALTRGIASCALLALSPTVTMAKAAPDLTITAPAGTLSTQFLPSVQLTIRNNTTSPIGGIQIIRASLAGHDGTIDERFLCIGQDGSCAEQGITVNPGRPVLVYLMTRRDGKQALPNGQYNGTVWLADAAGKEYDFTLKLAVSWPSTEIAGVAVITGGALLSWVVTRYLRGRALRDDALVPALQLVDTIASLENTVASAKTETKATFPNLEQRFAQLQIALKVSNLDNSRFLPPTWPEPWGAPRATAYAAFLTTTSATTAALTCIVESGIRVALVGWKGATAAEQTAILSALHDCDTGAVGVQTVAAAQTIVTQALARLRAAVPAGGVIAKALPLRPSEPTLASLRVEQSAIAGAFWLIWLFLTVAMGYGALILINPGFGEHGDLFKCFLWGLGVHLAGGQLQNLTSASSATVFNVAVPKVV